MMKFRNIVILAIFAIILCRANASVINWPKEIRTDKGIITMYQPQPEELDGQMLSGMAAVSVKMRGESDAVFGAIWYKAYLETDRDQRLYVLQNIRIDRVKFPEDMDQDKVNMITDFLDEEIPGLDIEGSIDELVATIENINKGNDYDNFNTAAPEIIFRQNPAILVTIDGDPKFDHIEGTTFQQIINSPFFIAFNTLSRRYWLYGDGMWFYTNDLQYGGWQYEPYPPTEIRQLLPDESITSSRNLVVPEIIVRNNPAELIVTDGNPQFVPISNANLLYIKNTENDVFMDIPSQAYYVLLSGRWFMSKNLNGPWLYVTSDHLPAGFALIPEGSEKDKVLACVAGTNAAHEALLDAMIPQTASVDRRDVHVDVSYDGNPNFADITGTRVTYAINSSYPVLYVNNRYYCCHNAVWFESAYAAGPWDVSVVIPNDFQYLPPSCPVYNVRYVQVYDYTPDVVYVGYTPGYLGNYVYGRTVVYGTGYHYTSWYSTAYYPRPSTYGYNMNYNPYTGWSMGITINYGGPSKWISYYDRNPHNSNTGGWWGPGSYKPPVYVPYNHYYGSKPAPVSTYKNIPTSSPDNNIYSKYTSGVYYGRRNSTTQSTNTTTTTKNTNGTRTAPVTTGGQRPSTSTNPNASTGSSGSQYSTRQSTSNRPVNAETGNRSNTSNTSESQTKPATVTRTGTPNNVYSDKNGNVYRKTNQGWQTRKGEDWKPVNNTNTPSKPPSDLQKQSDNRERSNQRSTNAKTVVTTTTKNSQGNRPAADKKPVTKTTNLQQQKGPKK